MGKDYRRWNQFEYMQWDGENTDELVKFCYKWDYDLCGYYKIFNQSGKCTLFVEPADLMRKSGVYIEKGQYAIRFLDGYRRYMIAVDDVNSIIGNHFSERN